MQNDVQSQIQAFQDLQTIAGKPLQELCKQNANLLVFPHCLNEHNNGIEELSICELVGNPNYDGDTICDVENVKVKTGNLMGFVGLGGNKNHNTKLEIRSRFTENSNDNGAIKAAFSVSADKKVYFSKGNLQYQASTGTWRFAENQYDIIGEDNANISSTYSGWIDSSGSS